MASITICPRCTSHLELPPGADPVAQVQCPICEVEFSLATVSPRELPQARLVEQVAAAAGENGAGASAHERLSRLMRSSTALAAPAELAPPPAETEESQDAAYDNADPESASPQPASHELQLGSSRLDQLLSDLFKNPLEPVPPKFAAAEHRDVAPATDVLDDDFAADFDADYETEDAYSAADEDVVVPSLSGAEDEHEIALDPRTVPRRQGPSGVRTLVGIVGGGALGLLLGAYGLLWLKGPAGDIAGLSQWLPPAMLPASMHSVADADDTDAAATRSEEATSFASTEEQEPADAPADAADAEEPPMLDAAVKPAAAVGPLVDAPAGTDPVLAEPPPRVKPKSPAAWPTTPIVADLRDVKLYSVAEFADLLDPADAARRQFLAGDLARQESWATMGPAYMAVAALAERFTLTDPADFASDLIALQMAAKNFFRSAVGDPARRTDLATIAARWLEHERRANNGVLLIGRVRDIRPSGRWTEYLVDVPLGESAVAANVLMDEVKFSVGDVVAVAGAIVPRPQEQLADYPGDSSQVVVAGYAFLPEEFVAPKPTAAVLKSLAEGAASE